MADVITPSQQHLKGRIGETGLEPGYAEDRWGPWKSHKLLLNDAISNDSGWGSRAGTYKDRFFQRHNRCSRSNIHSV
jgi:hypothetical protein